MLVVASFLFCLCLAACAALSSAFSGWIDPDSKAEVQHTRSFTDGEEYELIMSDEFERSGRTFKDGHDPMWTGIDRSDDDQTAQGRRSLQFYNSSYINTRNGTLVISTTTEETKWKGFNPFTKKYTTMKRHFRSGMVQSWNKFCYTGGILEVSVRLPGRADVGGLWPAVWLLGNLGRATYEASTNLMWPWSFEKCDRDLQKAQEISGCGVTSHFNLLPGKGRGATEIDLIEVMAGPSTPLPIVKNFVKRPYNSMTLQVAPGIPSTNRRPFPGTLPEWGFNWYENLTYGTNTSINPFFYGTFLSQTKKGEPVARSKEESYQCDAISSMTAIDEDFFDNFHKFRMEWQPGPEGYIHWYIDDEFKFGVEAASLKRQKAQIPNEPSYVIINTAISTSWGFPNPPPGCNFYDCKDPDGLCGMPPGFCKILPAEFAVDYVRVYQNKKDPLQTMGCNPRDYPTKRFIQAHPERYKHAEDKQPLKPIVTGGGKCKVNEDCGDGVCQYQKCKCRKDWQGPHCLVPTYSNTFSDWDEEEWISLSSPYIPSSLGLCFALFLVALAVTAFYAWRKQQAIKAMDIESKAASWL